MLTALAVSLSAFSIPIGASRCYPVQHLVTILCAVFLGPGYGVGAAFCTSLIPQSHGNGKLLAFPGSMVGALLSGLLYSRFHKLFLAYIGELSGTGILGGILCWPIGLPCSWGRRRPWFGFVLPFLASSFAGACIAAVVTGALYKAGVLESIRRSLEGRKSL